MKNRYIPFGYQIQNGDSVINTEQAATVQHIFYAYTEGQSFKENCRILDHKWHSLSTFQIIAGTKISLPAYLQMRFTVEPKDTQPLFQKKFTAKLPASEAIKP